MAGTAEKTDPALWDKVKQDITAGDRGGKPGQWSARKAQLAVHDYKQQDGQYKGRKAADNHLHQWTEQQWGTKSGQKSAVTGERYLPERAREHLSDTEYAKTTAKKRADTKNGKQFSPQPTAIARKTAADRGPQRHKPHGAPAERAGLRRSDLLAMAARSGITGRSRMSKAALAKALGT